MWGGSTTYGFTDLVTAVDPNVIDPFSNSTSYYADMPEPTLRPLIGTDIAIYSLYSGQWHDISQYLYGSIAISYKRMGSICIFNFRFSLRIHPADPYQISDNVILSIDPQNKTDMGQFKYKTSSNNYMNAGFTKMRTMSKRFTDNHVYNSTFDFVAAYPALSSLGDIASGLNIFAFDAIGNSSDLNSAITAIGQIIVEMES